MRTIGHLSSVRGLYTSWASRTCRKWSSRHNGWNCMSMSLPSCYEMEITLEPMLKTSQQVLSKKPRRGPIRIDKRRGHWLGLSHNKKFLRRGSFPWRLSSRKIFLDQIMQYIILRKHSCKPHHLRFSRDWGSWPRITLYAHHYGSQKVLNNWNRYFYHGDYRRW